MKAFLLFVYSGRVRMKSIDAVGLDLYTEANNYGLEDLRFLCEMNICGNLTVDNACDYFVFAHLNRACKLKAVATDFISKHLIQIVATEGYKSLEASRPQLLKDIIYKL